MTELGVASMTSRSRSMSVEVLSSVPAQVPGAPRTPASALYALGVLGAGIPEPSLLSPRTRKCTGKAPPSLPGPAAVGRLGGWTNMIGLGWGMTEGAGALGPKAEATVGVAISPAPARRAASA
eukprot:6693794-Alexandrium_andersonii.AAC.1